MSGNRSRQHRMASSASIAATAFSSSWDRTPRCTELPAQGAGWRLQVSPAKKAGDASLRLEGEVRKADAPLVLVSPHGEVTISQGRFRLAATQTTSWMRVDEGTAQLLQAGATKPVPVAAGNYARFGPSASAVVQPLAAAVLLVDDFEKQVNNWWPFGGEKEKIAPRRSWVSPGKVGKQAIRFDYDFGPTLMHAGMCFYTAPKQDWGRYRTLSFWFHGGQTNNEISMWVWTANGNYLWSFKDDFAGWRQISPPLTAFRNGNQPGRPEDFRGIKQVDFRVHTTGKGSFQIDQLQLLEHEILR